MTSSGSDRGDPQSAGETEGRRAFSEGTVRVELAPREAGKVGVLTIDNPNKLNALSAHVMDQLMARIAALSADAAVRALVITGSGNRAFCGGADIDEMAALDVQSAQTFISKVHGCCAAIREFPAPVIARLNGFALGAGLELAAACDLRVAAATAQIGMPEVRLGMPSVVEAALLPGLVGWGRARELLLLGEMYRAEQAASWGLIERVVPEAELDQQVENIIRSLLFATPEAVRRQKRLIRAWESRWLDEAVTAGIDSYVAAFASGEPREAIARYRSTRERRRGDR
jgi:enoyl-CoA hydratase/carnithine racemase